MKVEVNMNVDEMVQEITQKVIKEIKPIIKNDSEGDSIFDVKELAEYLKVKPAWVYQQTHVNTIPFIKIGNLLRFRKVDIDSWLSKSKSPALS